MEKRKTDPKLGLYIYNIIFASGKTHQEIADVLGVEPRTIDFYCSGQRRPSQINLLKLLKATNVNVEEIPF